MDENAAWKPPMGLALRHAHVRAARLFAQELEPLGLENGHAAILLHMDLLGVLTQRQLVDAMGMDKSAMVRALDVLESRGLVRREPHPTDRRAHALVMTDAGREVLDTVTAVVQRTDDRMAMCFTPQEREVFHALLIRFVEG